MSDKLQIDPNSGTAFIPGKAVVMKSPILKAVSDAKAKVPDVKKPTVPAPIDYDTLEIAKWGDNNHYPKTVMDAVKSNTIIAPALHFVHKAIYGSGVEYYKKTDDGKEDKTPIPEIDQFWKDANVKQYIREAAVDFTYFFNIFPDIILSKDRKKVVNLTRLKAYDCRYSKREENDLVPKQCYILDWDKTYDIEKAKKLPVIQANFFPVETTREETATRYVYPVSFPDPEKNYYALAPWHSIISSDWLDLANSIPTFKKAWIENAADFKYHIEFHLDYFTWRWPDFESKPDLKVSRIEEVIEEYNEMLCGPTNAGKTVTTYKKTNNITGKEDSYVTITPMDDKSKEGKFIEDSQEANSHILFALGIHPAIGYGTNSGSLGAGSGSDIREAYNLYVAMLEMYRDIILEPLYFIRDYNGWGDEVQFRFKDKFLMTADKITPSNRA